MPSPRLEPAQLCWPGIQFLGTLFISVPSKRGLHLPCGCSFFPLLHTTFGSSPQLVEGAQLLADLIASHEQSLEQQQQSVGGAGDDEFSGEGAPPPPRLPWGPFLLSPSLMAAAAAPDLPGHLAATCTPSSAPAHTWPV